MNLLLSAAALTLALDALAVRLRDDLRLAAPVSVIATVLFLLAITATWVRTEDERAELRRIAEAERERQRAMGQLQTLSLPLEAENDQRPEPRRRAA